MEKTGINNRDPSVNIEDYSYAQQILDTFNLEDKAYLVSLMKEFVPSDQWLNIDLNNCNYKDRNKLRNYGYVIRGVAKKMIKDKEKSDLNKKIKEEVEESPLVEKTKEEVEDKQGLLFT